MLFRPLAGLAAGFLAAGLMIAAPAVAQTLSTDQKKEVEALIKDYITRNPEIVREALMEVDRRQREEEKLAQRTALLAQKQGLINDPQAIVVGNPQGDVTLVEFFDYNCGYCKRSLADLQELVKADPKLRIVLRDFPILGPDSVEASKIAIAAKAQIQGEKYLAFHARLMDSKGRIGKDKALEVARSFNLDVTRLIADAESDGVKSIINRGIDIAEAIGINGTPAFVIGDDVLAGAVGVKPMAAAVASVRKCGKAVC